jgi:hypothetical protein
LAEHMSSSGVIRPSGMFSECVIRKGVIPYLQRLGGLTTTNLAFSRYRKRERNRRCVQSAAWNCSAKLVLRDGSAHPCPYDNDGREVHVLPIVVLPNGLKNLADDLGTLV